MFIDATNGLIKTVENFYIEGKVNGQKAVKKIINIYELKTLEWWISRLMLKLRFTITQDYVNTHSISKKKV